MVDKTFEHFFSSMFFIFWAGTRTRAWSLFFVFSWPVLSMMSSFFLFLIFRFFMFLHNILTLFFLLINNFTFKRGVRTDINPNDLFRLVYLFHSINIHLTSNHDRITILILKAKGEAFEGRAILLNELDHFLISNLFAIHFDKAISFEYNLHFLLV